MFERKEVITELHQEILNNSERFNIVLPDGYDDFICPISQLLMFDPILNNCNHIFENDSIKEWQEQKTQDHRNDCPNCRQPIQDLKPATAYKEKIHNSLRDISNYLKTLKPQPYALQKLAVDSKIETGNIYLETKDSEIGYVVRSPFDEKHCIRSNLTKKELEIVFQDSKLTPQKLYKDLNYNNPIDLYLPYILSITSSKGHTGMCQRF